MVATGTASAMRTMTMDRRMRRFDESEAN